MPKISMAIPHHLGQEDAKHRITSLISDARTKFAGQVTNLVESWNGPIDTFSFDATGFHITGTLDVQPSQVLVEVDLPFAAYLFKGGIENEIRTRASKLLE